MFESAQLAWLSYIQALATPTIALLVVVISFFQWRIARATLREKLFDRRMKIFQQVQEFLSDFATHAKVSDVAITKYSSVPKDAKFLFGPEVVMHLEKVWQKALEHRRLLLSLEKLDIGDLRSTRVDEVEDVLAWLLKQHITVSTNFERYMGLGTYR